MLLILALLAGAGAARAQAAMPLGSPGQALGGSPSPTPGDSLAVSLMTIGAGGEVWQLFGHNALVIRDGRTGREVAYNWGTFDFNQPHFVERFLTGETRYWLLGMDAGLMADHYAQVEDRTVLVQALALAPAQRAALRDFVEWNAREENRYYRYDYYRDNCSTRVRDALDRALGGALRTALAGVPTGTTWRSETRRLTDAAAPTYAGIQLALGGPADAPLDAWARGFLPVQLARELRAARVRAPDGRLVPLVSAERVVYASTRPAELPAPRGHALAFLLAGVTIAALLGVTAWTAATAGALGRAAFGLVAGGWALVLGAAGTALLLAGTVTKHAPYMGRNWNLLGANPLALVLLPVLATASITGARAGSVWPARAARLAALLAGLTVVGAVATVLPRVGQESGELYAMLLPATGALAVALGWLARRRPA